MSLSRLLRSVQRRQREIAAKAPGAQCWSCPLRRQPFVPTVLTKKSPVAFVAEAPGEQEERLGVPLVGPAGVVLNAALRRVGIDRTVATVTNTVLCRPPLLNGKNQPPPLGAVAACAPRLALELTQAQPKIIVALGGVAGQHLTGRKQGPMTLRKFGVMHKSPSGVSYPFPILVTGHPAYYARNRDEMREFDSDLRQALEYVISLG